MNSALVSVIMPAYNCERFITEAVLSVLNQSYPHIELIVVDDGSVDHTKECVLNLQLCDSRIKYIIQQNAGVAAARNRALTASQGEYLAFLDADDVWLHEHVALLIEKIKTDSFGLVHSDAFIIDEDSNDTRKAITGKEGFLLDDLLAWKQTQVSGPSGVLIKREVIQQIGLFDTHLSTSADFDFFIRVAAKFKIGRVSKSLWRYRVHSANMHKNIVAMENDVMYVYRKSSSYGLFKTALFERRCYSNMYLILAASWAGDGRNKMRGFLFTFKAIKIYPAVVFEIGKRAAEKIFLVKELLL